jgi:hypothetical protein
MRYSCKAVVGHGQKCEPNYQCDACAAKQKYIPRIEKLEAALRWIVEQERQTAHPTVCAIVKTARKALEAEDD